MSDGIFIWLQPLSSFFGGILSCGYLLTLYSCRYMKGNFLSRVSRVNVVYGDCFITSIFFFIVLWEIEFQVMWHTSSSFYQYYFGIFGFSLTMWRYRAFNLCVSLWDGCICIWRTSRCMYRIRGWFKFAGRLLVCVCVRSELLSN